MEIFANIESSKAGYKTSVRTGESTQIVQVPAKNNGRGSNVNGGELLMLALATCYCNDLYREAERLQISIDSVEIEATADFPGIGLAAKNIRYRTRVSSAAAPSEIDHLIRHTDSVAEIHNTIRAGAPVTLMQ